MRTTISVLILILTLLDMQAAIGQNAGRIVLPNPKLLRCNSSDCFQLWTEAPEQKDVLPKQILVDTDHGCIYGMTALYDKSIPLNRIKSAIDDRYKESFYADASSSTVYLWRVEPQKFVIQLSAISKRNARKKYAEAGTTQAIYLAFGGKSACSGATK